MNRLPMLAALISVFPFASAAADDEFAGTYNLVSSTRKLLGYRGRAARKRGRSRDPVGYDADKKVKGIKRNAVVDTIGLLLGVKAIQRPGPGRRRGAYQKDPPPVPLHPPRLCGWRLQRRQPRHRSGCSKGYPGDRQAHGQKGGFKVIRRRWVIERTFSWLRRNRRLMAHYEAIAIIAEGFAKLAMTSVMLKRTAKDAQIAPMGAILPGGKIRPFPRCFSAVLTDYVDRNGQRLDTRSRARVLLPPGQHVFAHEWRKPITPCGFDEEPAGPGISGLGDAAALDALAR